MTKEQILKILKAHFIYTKIAEKIAKEIMEVMEKPENPKFHDLGCEIQHTGKCNCKDENYEQKPDDELSEEKKKLIQSIPF